MRGEGPANGRDAAQAVFVHFRDTSFIGEMNDNLIGFLVGFLSPSVPEEAYIHFVGVHPDLSPCSARPPMRPGTLFTGRVKNLRGFFPVEAV
jgi:hypothetical protein